MLVDDWLHIEFFDAPSAIHYLKLACHIRKVWWMLMTLLLHVLFSKELFDLKNAVDHVEEAEDLPMFGTLLDSSKGEKKVKKDPFEDDVLKHVDEDAVDRIPFHFKEIFDNWKDFNESSDTLNGIFFLFFVHRKSSLLQCWKIQ
jgi:hypothetical protein